MNREWAAVVCVRLAGYLLAETVRNEMMKCFTWLGCTYVDVNDQCPLISDQLVGHILRALKLRGRLWVHPRLLAVVTPA